MPPADKRRVLMTRALVVAVCVAATAAACAVPAGRDAAVPAAGVDSGPFDTAGADAAPAEVPANATAPADMSAVGSAAPDAADPVAVDPDDTGWRDLDAGAALASRVLAVRDASGTVLDRALVVRIDPAAYRFDVAYRPGAPQSLAAWQAETGAAVVINGGYFTEENVATGLIVAAGTPSGASYGDFAGMFSVTDAGPEVRWLAQRPFDASEPLVAAVQAFPLLVRPDGQAAYPEDNGAAARRTVIGQDHVGRIVLVVMPLGGLSLHGLSEWLAASELDLRIAFNLDGGASSGLLLPDGTGEPSLAPLPAVITVEGR